MGNYKKVIVFQNVVVIIVLIYTPSTVGTMSQDIITASV